MRSPLDELRSRLPRARVFASPQSRRRFLVHVVVVAVVFVALAVVVRRQFPLLTDARALRAFIHSFGFWGPAVLVALQALQVVLAPIPGQVLALVAGYLYGAWLGTVYNMLGITIGSTAAFWLSRRYGRAYVERIVHPDALERFDSIGDTHVRLALFVFFLVPGLPDDVLCFAGGLTRLPLWQLVVLAIVGRAPGFFLVNVVGAYLETGRVLAALVLGTLLVALSVLAYLNRDRFFRMLS